VHFWLLFMLSVTLKVIRGFPDVAGLFVRPVSTQWGGRYLATGCESGEVLIIDSNNVPPSGDL